MKLWIIDKSGQGNQCGHSDLLLDLRCHLSPFSGRPLNHLESQLYNIINRSQQGYWGSSINEYCFQFQKEDVENRVDDIFNRLDKNRDGVVTIDEFINVCQTVREKKLFFAHTKNWIERRNLIKVFFSFFFLLPLNRTRPYHVPCKTSTRGCDDRGASKAENWTPLFFSDLFSLFFSPCSLFPLESHYIHTHTYIYRGFPDLPQSISWEFQV